MNTEDYVSYPIAIALKKAGFDWECDHYYTNGYVNDNPEDISRVVKLHIGRLYNHNMVISSDGECVSTPTLWQAQKWLRNMKRLSIEPYANIAVAWNYNIADLDNFAENIGGEVSFPSYESALSAGIAAALKLIENNKNN